jgi:hypothetical protein
VEEKVEKKQVETSKMAKLITKLTPAITEESVAIVDEMVEMTVQTIEIAEIIECMEKIGDLILALQGQVETCDRSEPDLWDRGHEPKFVNKPIDLMMPTIDLVPPDSELSQVSFGKSNFLNSRTGIVNRMMNYVDPVVECGIRHSRERIWLVIEHRRARPTSEMERRCFRLDADRKEKAAMLQAALDLIARWLQDSKGGVWGSK